MWGSLPLVVGYGWLAGGSGGAAGAGVGAVCLLLAFVAPLELSTRYYGGIRVVGDHLFVGRASVPIKALDLSTLRFQETADVYRVFGKGQLKSNPLWLRHTVALEGHHDGHAVQVIVRTNRPDELVRALRASAGVHRPD